MPLPKPRKNEDQDQFMSRCMGDSVMNKDFPERSQRYAVCMRQWKDTKEASILERVQRLLRPRSGA